VKPYLRGVRLETNSFKAANGIARSSAKPVAQLPLVALRDLEAFPCFTLTSSTLQ
jgi:hypothetical protein